MSSSRQAAPWDAVAIKEMHEWLEELISKSPVQITHGNIVRYLALKMPRFKQYSVKDEWQKHIQQYLNDSEVSLQKRIEMAHKTRVQISDEFLNEMKTHGTVELSRGTLLTFISNSIELSNVPKSNLTHEQLAKGQRRSRAVDYAQAAFSNAHHDYGIKCKSQSQSNTDSSSSSAELSFHVPGDDIDVNILNQSSLSQNELVQSSSMNYAQAPSLVYQQRFPPISSRFSPCSSSYVLDFGWDHHAPNGRKRNLAESSVGPEEVAEKKRALSPLPMDPEVTGYSFLYNLCRFMLQVSGTNSQLNGFVNKTYNLLAARSNNLPNRKLSSEEVHNMMRYGFNAMKCHGTIKFGIQNPEMIDLSVCFVRSTHSSKHFSQKLMQSLMSCKLASRLFRQNL